MSEEKEIWKQVTKNLESKLSKSEFSTWFSQTTLEKLHPNLAIIGVRNKFVANWLSDTYHIQIRKSFETVLDRSLQVRYNYDTPQGTLERPDPELSRNLDEYHEHNLDSSMTFERFLIGDCNRFAFLSALEVGNSPSNKYNPLYIFSEWSLGKTHLLNAIGNHVVNKNRFSRVRYLPSNTFTSDFTYSIKSKTHHDFEERYCGLDLLLFDDVHLLANRIRTQEEFLSIFNFLYRAKRQIVITGNRPPNQLTKFSSRLKSRLGWGLISEIKAPDQNTKIEIIRKKVKGDNIKIPDDVIFFIAKSNKDIKGLMRSIIRVKTYNSLNDKDINISTVKSLIRGDGRRKIGIEDIKSIVAGYFNISLSELTSTKKKRHYSYPRQLAIYLCREYTNLSFKEIGNLFGNKDHSTVIYSVNRIKKYKEKKKEIRNDLDGIEKLLD